MKKITKTFYVDTDVFKDLKLITGWNIYVQAEKSDIRPHEIQISWTEPEKKIEITESQFDDIFDNALELRGYCKAFKHEIMQKLFGASDE